MIILCDMFAMFFSLNFTNILSIKKKAMLLTS